MSFPLMMRKSDFVVMPYSDQVVDKDGTHIGITIEQYKYLAENPKVRGPKLFHFYVTSNGMKQEERDAAFMDIVRAEQDRQDKGAPSYVADVKAEKQTADPVAEQVQVFAPEVPATAVVPDALAETLKTLDAITDKDELVKYAENTLGVTVKVPGRAGRDRVLAAIKAKLMTPEADVTVPAEGE